MEPSESASLNESSNKWIYLIIGLIIATIAGGVAYTARSFRNNETITISPTPLSSITTPTATSAADGIELAQGEPLIITINGDKFRFSEPEITAKKGQKIQIKLNSIDMPHDFVIDELNVKSDVAPAGENTTVEFTADKVGEFEYFCSVGNHRKMGMVGKLMIIEDLPVNNPEQ